jgi:hypothetical protein
VFGIVLLVFGIIVLAFETVVLLKERYTAQKKGEIYNGR